MNWDKLNRHGSREEGLIETIAKTKRTKLESVNSADSWHRRLMSEVHLLEIETLLENPSLPHSPLAQEPKWFIQWTDYTNNPIDLKSPGSRAYKPYVLYNQSWPAESRFRIWYDIASAAGIAYSSSADGVNWSDGVAVTGLNTDGTYPGGRPVVLFNADGQSLIGSTTLATPATSGRFAWWKAPTG